MYVPVLGLSGYSGSGKTTLLERLIPELSRRGIRVATIKHDAHGLSFDGCGKDSWRFSAAGATSSVVIGPEQTAVFHNCVMELEQAAMLISGVDLILVEGFKNLAITQLGIEREENHISFPKPSSCYAALITDRDGCCGDQITFSPNDVEEIASYIVENMKTFSHFCTRK